MMDRRRFGMTALAAGLATGIVGRVVATAGRTHDPAQNPGGESGRQGRNSEPPPVHHGSLLLRL